MMPVALVACTSPRTVAPAAVAVGAERLPSMAKVQFSSLADAEAAAATSPRVERVLRREHYRIELGPYALEIDAEDGARVVRFSLDGQNALVEREQSPEAYGSSFWPSPQSDWQWPPPFEFALLPWHATVSEAGELVLRSGTNQKLGLAAEQRVFAEPEHDCFAFVYTLVNRGTAPRKVAPWQNSRVRPGGLTFYPSAERTLPQSTLELAPNDGIVWFLHDPATMKRSGKAFGDASEGWLAQVDGRLLFLKLFPDVPKERQAPGEAEIEIYVHETGRFVEMEQQGAYAELAPGSTSSWTVRWLLRRLPDGLEAKPGSVELVRFVRGVIAEVRASRTKPNSAARTDP
jgi:hypothetical protein